jgi:hypothetical protein
MAAGGGSPLPAARGGFFRGLCSPQTDTVGNLLSIRPAVKAYRPAVAPCPALNFEQGFVK